MAQDIDEIRRKLMAQPDQSNQYIADAVVAGAPGLISLLTGGSAAKASALMDKGNQYAMNRGKQEEVTKDKISVIDDNGEPVNILTRDSLGKKPYYQQKLGGLNQQQATGKLIPGKHKINGSVRPTLTNNVTGEVKDQLTGEVYTSGDAYLPPQFKSSRGIGGGYNVTAIDPLTGKMKESQLDPGIGDVMGGVSKEEAISGIKSAEQAKGKSYKALEALNSAKRALTILEKPKLSPEQAAQGIFAVMKANNGERLSDADAVQAKGTEFKSYVREFEDWASGKVAGDPNPRTIAAFREAARDQIKAREAEIRSIKGHYVPEKTLPKQGQKKLETIVGGADGKVNDTIADLREQILRKLQTKKFKKR